MHQDKIHSSKSIIYLIQVPTYTLIVFFFKVYTAFLLYYNFTPFRQNKIIGKNEQHVQNKYKCF